MWVKRTTVLLACLLALLGGALAQTQAQAQTATADSLHARGLSLFEAGAYPEALDAWNLAIAQAPRAVYFYQRGLCFAELGNVEASLLALKTAVGLDSSLYKAHRALAELYWLKTDLLACLEAVNRALAVVANDPESLFIRGRLHLVYQRYAAAAADFTAYLEQRPADPEGRYMRGKAFRGNAQYTEAIVDYQAALAELPDWPDALNDLGLVLTETHRPAEAIPYLERATALDPSSATAHFNLGIALEQVNRLDEACVAWRKAHDLGDADAFRFVRRYCR